MMDDPEYVDLDHLDRALALHEAGHAVVAREHGADVVFVQIDLKTGDGRTGLLRELDDDLKRLAICVAGCKAEHVFEVVVPRQRDMNKGDFRKMRALLTRIPVGQRRAARASAYSFAEQTIRNKRQLVERIADALLQRRWISPTTLVRIEGDDLAALFGN
jgi:hypothetical protein